MRKTKKSKKSSKASAKSRKERQLREELRWRQFRHKTAEGHGLALELSHRKTAEVQLKCTHRKGGYIERNGKISAGHENDYAVVKHQHMNGDVWVRCLRCGRTWKPPVRKNYSTELQYFRAMVEYYAALEFPTRNVMSTSIQAQFLYNQSKELGDEKFRLALANS